MIFLGWKLHTCTLFLLLLVCNVTSTSGSSTSDTTSQPQPNSGSTGDFQYLPTNQREFAMFSDRSSNNLVKETIGAVTFEIKYGLGFILKDKNYALLELDFTIKTDSVNTQASIVKMLLMPEDFETVKYVTNKGLSFTSPYVYKLIQGLYFVISFPIMNFMPENIDVSMLLQIKGNLGGTGFEASINKTIPSLLVKRKVYDAEAYASYKDFFIEGRLPTHTNVNENKPGEEDKIEYVKLKQVNKKESGNATTTTTKQKPKEPKKSFFETYKLYIIVGVLLLIGGLWYFTQQQPAKAFNASMSQPIQQQTPGNSVYF